MSRINGLKYKHHIDFLNLKKGCFFVSNRLADALETYLSRWCMVYFGSVSLSR